MVQSEDKDLLDSVALLLDLPVGETGPSVIGNARFVTFHLASASRLSASDPGTDRRRRDLCPPLLTIIYAAGYVIYSVVFNVSRR